MGVPTGRATARWGGGRPPAPLPWETRRDGDVGTAMQGRTKRQTRTARRAPRGHLKRTKQKEARADRTPETTKRLTLGDFGDHGPVLAAAALLGKAPRCIPAVAKQHAEAVATRYGIAIDDLALREAVAYGGLKHLLPVSPLENAIRDWWRHSLEGLRTLTKEGVGDADSVLVDLLRQFINLTRRAARYFNLRGYSDAKLTRRAQALAARAVADVLRQRRGGARDWFTTVRVLEYYGWNCGMGSLRAKKDRLRKLVERRTPAAR
jgi:hypothetical protein